MSAEFDGVLGICLDCGGLGFVLLHLFVVLVDLVYLFVC